MIPHTDISVPHEKPATYRRGVSVDVSAEHTGTASTDRTGGRLPLVAVCLGYFMIIMDATVVNTALPRIGRDLGASVSGLQWVVAGYTLVFACLLLSAGSAGDRLGARRVFLTGLVTFTAASATCGLAPTIAVLLVARVVQGVGAALVLPTSLALINASFSDRTRRARAIGVWGGLAGVAAGSGPVLGGMLTNWVGWPAIFAINVPIGIAAILLTLRFVVAPAPKTRTGLDPAGQVLSVPAVAALAYGLIEAQPRGWVAPDILAAFAFAAVCGAGFVLVERHGARPMLPPALFRVREFTASVAIGGALNLGFYGQLFLLTLYLQDVRHFSPLVTGLAMLPQCGVAALASWFGGRCTARFGARRVMVTGLSIGSLGLLSMTLAGVHSPYWTLIGPLLVIGFGTAFTMPAATTATIEAAPAHQAGTASGTLNASRQTGSTLGVAIFGTVTAGASSWLAGYHLSMFIGALVFAGGAVLGLFTRHAE